MCLNEEFPPLSIVPRTTWGAVPPKKEGIPLIFPIPYVIVHFLSGTELGETSDECTNIMRDLQKRHMEEFGFSDIGFNFVIGGDRKVYEGKGWNAQPESIYFTELNRKRFDIAYMGDLSRDTLPFEMLYLALQLLSQGVKYKFLEEEYDTIEIPEHLEIEEDESDMGDAAEGLDPLILVPRDEWGALPSKCTGEPMTFPLPYVVVTWTPGTEECETEEECTVIMKDLQKKHMDEEGFADVGYNFVIGGDGRVYEGRGWNIQPESKKFAEYNGKRLDIAYMGDLERNDCPWEMYIQALQLLHVGKTENKLEEEFESIEDPEPETEPED